MSFSGTKNRVKVSKFQNENMDEKIWKILPWVLGAEFFKFTRSYFGQCNDFEFSFRNFLTFSVRHCCSYEYNFYIRIKINPVWRRQGHEWEYPQLHECQTFYLSWTNFASSWVLLWKFFDIWCFMPKWFCQSMSTTIVCT